jgi:FkbM family methyltransferase
MNLTLSLVEKMLACINLDLCNNWDSFRYGSEQLIKSSQNREIFKRFVHKRGYVHLSQVEYINHLISSAYGEIISDLEVTYDLLSDDKSKEIYVELLAYRTLGHRKVKLSANNKTRDKLESEVRTYVDYSDSLTSNYPGKKLFRSSWNKDGKNLSLYLTERGSLNASFLKQYECARDGDSTIKVNSGDIVIDCGGCWGDTTIEFSSEVGKSGKVYVFEFVPYNLEILRKNIQLNDAFSDNIQIVENPAWSSPGLSVYVEDKGPGSSVQFEPVDGATVVNTQTIDNLVDENLLTKVDFIKMDIEGAELPALRGAEKTIRKYRPKLAISLYHSMHDFCMVPQWIDSLKLGYVFYVRHFTIHSEETVLFAISS